MSGETILQFVRTPAAQGGAGEEAGARPEAVGRLRQADLERLVRGLPSGVAAGVVELSSGMPVAFSTLDQHSKREFDLLAAATTGLFHDTTVTTIERMDREHLASPEERREALQQVIVQSRHMLYLFLRCRREPDLVLVSLCRADANLGLALMVSREALQRLELAP
ncbi:MAG: hypothetical protein KJ058_09330 [Thermoanaerobaculia bacterium]|nr:hypothetical protein [Thermoanaerobaculia bacterium]